jgi:CDP-glucose 4,6-dehydratase
MFNNCYKGKKVFVTGHTGFKGSWLVAWLKMLGAEVAGLALEPDTQPAHFALLKFAMQSHFVDIRDYEKLKKALHDAQPEIVFHLAAQPLVRDSYDRPLYTFETNVMGTANVLNACRDLASLRAVVVVTSDKCYENKEWVWGYRENDPMGGYDPYSSSKGCAELVVASMRNSYFNVAQFRKKHQVLVASARAGNVIGGGDWAKDRLIPDIVRATAARNAVQIRCPQATRPWQHVLECLSGYLALGEKLLTGEARFAEGWNFAPSSEGDAKVLRVVQTMQTCWSNLRYEINSSVEQPHEAHLLKLDCSKAHAVLKWRNVWELDKTIAITTGWYRNFYAKKELTTYFDIENYVTDANALGVAWACS